MSLQNEGDAEMAGRSKASSTDKESLAQEDSSSFAGFSDDENAQEHEVDGESDDPEASDSDADPYELGPQLEAAQQRDDEDEIMEEYDITRKDAAELELEKAVFGDSTGFRSALKNFNDSITTETFDEPPLRSAQDTIFPVPDQDLFFIDESPAEALRPRELNSAQEDVGEEYNERAAPAWEDSDDERMQISLMSVPRLRKLRNFEGEDIISGNEYQRRLRRQYRALHPPPAWATWRPQEANSQAKKRQKIKATRNDADTGDSEAGSDSSNDVYMADGDGPIAPSLSDILRSSQPLTRRKPSSLSHSTIPRLKPEVIDIDRLPDIIPTSSPQPHATTSLSLHPSLPLLITSGLSGMLYMHHIRPFPTPPDPPNPLVTSLHMKNAPLSTASFSPLAGTQSDPKIYMAAGRRSFHTWTLPTGNISKTSRIDAQQHGDIQQRVRTIKPSPCGRFIGIQGSSKKGGGVINILSAQTSQWIAQARGEGRGGLADFCWWSDGGGLSLVGKLGEVAEWSVEERRIVLRWQDQGGVGVTVMALGADPEKVTTSGKKKKSQNKIGPDRWTVLGTNTGFVTVYDRAKVLRRELDWTTNGQNGAATHEEERSPAIMPETHATLSHLTTPISHLSVSACGQVLAMASKWKRDAIRLVHLTSGTVYRNWPTARTPLGRISSMTLGECEGVVAGSRDEEGRGVVLIVGNEQGIVRDWLIRG